MSFTQAFWDAITRLKGYNLGIYNAVSNALGLSGVGGMAANWAKHSKDMATVGEQIATAFGTIAASVSAIGLTWDTATSAADPGAGKIRATAAPPTAGSFSLIISTIDVTGQNVSALIADMGASTSSAKARARLVKVGNPAVYVDVSVTSVSGAGAYRTVAVTFVGGPGGFAAGDAVALGWVRTGDKGDAGGATLPAGTLAAPGLAVTGDANTGLAQVGGADTLSVIPGGTEVIRFAPNAAKVYGAMTLADRGDGFGAALTLTPGAGPDWHLYSRVFDGALVFFHFKNRLGEAVAVETMLLKDSGVVDFSQRPTVAGQPISAGFTPAVLSTPYTVVLADTGKLFECTTALTLSLTAAATLGAGFTFAVWNNNTATVVVDPSGAEMVNGGATLTLAGGQWAIISCSGTAFKAITQSGQSPCTWSATDKESALIIINGRLTAYVAAGGAMQSGRATVALSGKRYWEVWLDAVAASGLSAIVGIATLAATFGSSHGFATSANGYGYASDTGNKLTNAGEVTFGSAWNSVAAVIGIAYDDVSTPGTVKIWFSLNGVWQGSGNPATGANPAFSIAAAVFYPAITCKNGGQVSARYSSTSWGYTAPNSFNQIM